MSWPWLVVAAVNAAAGGLSIARENVAGAMVCAVGAACGIALAAYSDPMPGPKADADVMLEAAWRNQVVDYATMCDWRIYYVETAVRQITRRSGAKVMVRTVNPAGVGFPDLVLVRKRDRRLIFAELKREKRSGGGSWNVTPEQETWLEDLRAVGAGAQLIDVPPAMIPSIEVYVWRPSDLPAVMQVLR